jgi:hypothetical protein
MVANDGRPVPSQTTTGPVGDSVGVPVVGLCEHVERWDHVETGEGLGSVVVLELVGDVGLGLVADPDRSHA